jgi:guanyl-specific ribonuclease Sa
MLVRQEVAGKPLLTAVRLTERKGLGGKARVTASAPFVVAADAASVEQVLLPSNAESLIVVGKSGEVRTYADDGTTFSFLQSFAPLQGCARSFGGFGRPDLRRRLRGLRGAHR